jgi:hypothetical protein
MRGRMKMHLHHQVVFELNHLIGRLTRAGRSISLAEVAMIMLPPRPFYACGAVSYTRRYLLDVVPSVVILITLL